MDFLDSFSFDLCGVAARGSLAARVRGLAADLGEVFAFGRFNAVGPLFLVVLHAVVGSLWSVRHFHFGLFFLFADFDDVGIGSLASAFGQRLIESAGLFIGGLFVHTNSLQVRPHFWRHFHSTKLLCKTSDFCLRVGADGANRYFPQSPARDDP